MKRIIFTLLVICFYSCNNTKQATPITAQDTTPHYFNSKIKSGQSQDSLQFYLNKLEKVPKTTISDSLKAEYAYITSRFNNRLKLHDAAIVNLKEATSFAKDKLNSKREALYFRALMATYFRYKNDYLNGLGTNEKLLSLLEANDYKNKAYVYNYKQRVKSALKQWDDALIANDSATALFLKAKDTNNYAMSKIGRASIYNNQQKKKKAIKILHEATSLENNLSVNGKYQLYSTLGANHYEDKNYAEAENAYKKALVFSKQLSVHRGKTRVINNYINLANVSIEANKLLLAESYVDSVFQIGLENIEYINQKNALTTKLEVAYRKKAGIEVVMEQLDAIFNYQEKNYDNQINNELEVLKTSFANERELIASKKEVEIKNITFKRNQYLLLATLLIVVMGAITIFSILRQRKFKIEKQNLLLQQRLLRSQMNPHFTFNSLSLIKEGIDSNSKESSKYIAKLSRLLRSIFENSTKDFILLEDELQSLQDYMDLQQFRFPDKFTYTLDNTIVFEDDVYIPPMLLQPFVENAIIHGFKTIDYIGELNITIHSENKDLICTIKDNGVGLDANSVNKRSSVKLIDQFLKQMTGKGVSMKTERDRLNGNDKDLGTMVILQIPYKLD